MNVKIYDEKTGLMIFPSSPGKEPERDESIVNLSINGIDLYMEKKAKTLGVSCRVLTYKDSGESSGYYIRSLSKYEDDSFTEFKKESNKVLRAIGLQHNVDDVNNVVLDNIEKLDLDIYFHEDTEIIGDILASGEFLEYKAGNIDEITILCKDILKRLNNSKIAISSKESTLGDVNILRIQRHEESLRPNERTKQLLDKHRKDLIEKKRKEEESRAKEKINDGTNLIKEGLTILRSTGYEPNEISTEVDKIYDEISTSNKIKLKEILKPKEKEKGKDRGKEKERSKDGGKDGGRDRSKDSDKDNGKDNIGGKPKPSIITIIVILAIIIMFITSIVWGFPVNLSNKSQTTGNDTKTPPVATLPPIKNAGSGNGSGLNNNSANTGGTNK